MSQIEANNYNISLGITTAAEADNCFMHPSQLTDVDASGKTKIYLRPYECASLSGAQMLAEVTKGSYEGQLVLSLKVSPTIYTNIWPDGSSSLSGWYIYNWLILHNWTWSGGIYSGSPLLWTPPPVR